MKKIGMAVWVSLICLGVQVFCNFPARSDAPSPSSLGIRLPSSSELPDDIRNLLLGHGQALLIGVSTYEDRRWEALPRAVVDQLERLEQGLRLHFRSVRVLLDPTENTISSQLKGFFTQAGADERLFVFYFGHGFTDTNYKTRKEVGFITGTDTPFYDPQHKEAISKAISMNEYDNLTTISPANQILTVFDSCFSGTIFSSKLAPTVPKKMDFDRVRNALRRPVRYYITAGRANEKVPADLPMADIFLRGINDGQADYNQDGFVTGEEWACISRTA